MPAARQVASAHWRPPRRIDPPLRRAARSPSPLMDDVLRLPWAEDRGFRLGEGDLMPDQFRGLVNLDIRDSVPDWSSYEQPKAPSGTPNVLYVVLDDVG